MTLRSKKTVTCVLLLSLFLVYAASVFAKAALAVAQKSYNFRTFASYLVILMALIPALISPLATWAEKDGVKDYINSWSLLQKNYEEITSTTMEQIFEGGPRISKIGTLVSLFVPSATGLWTVHYSLSDMFRGMVGLLPVTYGVITNYLFFTFWLINVRLLSRLIKDYGRLFEQVKIPL
ncbi:uncharacterized protein [Bemisia tabaci]|uniref:uncharacterized protein n=1 Tax=Bemisia tabaci TaxID=7038 RepID=UPI003B2856D3